MIPRYVEKFTEEQKNLWDEIDLLKTYPIPRASHEDFSIGNKEVPPKEREELDELFHQFMPPRVNKYDSLTCICGANMSGLLGCFEWGLANGEGHCSRCWWPARAYHRLKNGNHITMIMLYHPDELVRSRD